MNMKKFYKELFALVLPIAFQDFMSAVVGASDALMLGWLDQQSLSAVSLATQVTFVLNLFTIAFTIGLTILAAQYWGKGDRDAVEHVLAIALRFSVLVSMLFAAAAILIPGVLMRIFTSEHALIGPGMQYLRIVGISYVLSGISQVYLCVMKNSGRTVRSTIYGSVGMVLNLILNLFLIFGVAGFPALGIAGAAVATVIARVVELLLVLMENRKKDQVRMRISYIKKPDPQLQKDFIHYTSPVLANEIAWGCGFTMYSVIMGHLGSDAVAANSLANIVKNIIASFAYGVGTGSGIIVGNELGRGNLVLARKYGDKLCHLALAIGAVSGGVILLVSPLIHIFASNLTAQADQYLSAMLLMCSYYMIGKSINCTVISGIFCAGGDTKFGLLCDAINMWCVMVPIGLLCAFVFKLPILVVYFIMNLDEFTKLPIVYRHYKKYQWVQDLTRAQES